MIPLIHWTPELEAVFAVFMGVVAIFFLRSNANHRAIIVLFSIFTFSLQVDIGLAFYPFRIIGIVAAPLMLLDRSKFSWGFHHVFSRPLSYIFAYAVIVAVCGYWEMPRLVGELGGFRSAVWRPLIAFATMLLVVPPLWVVFRGLHSHKAIESFLTWWTVFALASVGLAVVQELSFLLGDPWLGMIREDIESSIATVSVGGVSWLRVCALSGEPKQFGMCMLITVAMLVGLDESFRRLWIYRERWWLIATMLGGVLFSFSSGAILSTIGLLLFSWLQSGQRLKQLAITVAIFAALGFLVVPGAVTELIDARVTRIADKLTSSVLVATGEATTAEASDDKDAAAMAYMIQNPRSILFGHGLGVAPFYYNHLVHPAWRTSFQDPNSGCTYALVSIGVVGVLICIYLFRKVIMGAYVPRQHRNFIRTLFLCTLVMWLPMHMFDWLIVFLALASTPGWQIASKTGKPSRTTKQKELVVV